MRTLKTRKLLIALVAGSFVFAVIQGAMGITRDQCRALDGYFSPPNASGVYWCLTKNKTLISCGGSIPFCTAMRRVDNGRLHDRTIRKIIELRGTEGGIVVCSVWATVESHTGLRLVGLSAGLIAMSAFPGAWSPYPLL